MKPNSDKYLYIMLSTLNQMVNYIPIIRYKFVNIVNITQKKEVKGEFKRNETNKLWDKRLDNLVADYSCEEEECNIEIDSAKLSNKASIADEIERNYKVSHSNHRIWNITGGQRPLILAIQCYVERMRTKNNKNQDIFDHIIYLEGNSGKIHHTAYKNGNEIKRQPKFLQPDGSYSIDELNISTAFRLMGYNIKNAETENIYTGNDAYSSLYDTYISESREARAALINFNSECNKTNKSVGGEKILKTDSKETKEQKNQEKRKRTLREKKKKVQNIQGDFSAYGNQLDSLFEYDKTYPFGYALEEMVIAKLYKVFKNDIAEIRHSVVLKFDNEEENKEVNNTQLDEIDILVVTKKGQLINFECKSGIMSGDVAKSTKYSTYAVAGVYGQPILITPLTSTEIKDLDKNFTKEKVEEWQKQCKNIKSAIASAKRANLEVWGIDEIEERFKELIK